MNPSDTIIQLVVAKCIGDPERLNVHRGVLCQSSKFFQNSMKPEWSNMQPGSNVIDLPDDAVHTVTDYVKWLYYDKIPIERCEASCDTREKNAAEAEKVFVALAEAYVLGEKIIDVRYKNAVIKAAFAAQKKFDWSMGPESVNVVYEGTPAGPALRRLVAADVAHKAHDDSKKGDGWMQFIEGYPRDALVDALKATVKIRATTVDSNTRDKYYFEEV